MPQHRLRAGGVSAVIVLALASGAACGPAEDAATTSKTAAAPARPSAGATAAASNGVEKLRPAEILSRARKATASARYLRMRGQIDDGDGKVALDVGFAGAAKATGWFQQGRQRVEITRIGKDVYIKGNKAFLQEIGGKSAVQLLAGKHLRTTAKSADFKDLAAFTDRTSLLKEALKAAGTWKKGAAGTVAGTPALTLDGGPGVQIQVATSGEPYVLRLDGGPGNRIEYLAYGTPVDVRRPPAGAVVDGDGF
ncbi:hypothetical protein [Actinomadura bangladeshensis]|uniref:Lipoprotein n=1 Tax=Actinomadura bangladeshensis TaxID=453573 RepID=A0A4V2XL70_9ACTN|nr:hypothetical protein [Actinomadura bangladeshensis]TDC09316.1 hypothetical protein E1284_29710 [Actinomadura bangladeshensis]